MTVELVRFCSSEECGDYLMPFLGGWFVDGMRWRDYHNTWKPKSKQYAEALRAYILQHSIKRTG